MAKDSIKFESKRVEAWLTVTPKRLSLAALRALKKGTRSAHTDSSRTVSKNMGIKVGDVRRRLRRIEPNARTLSGKVLGSFTRLPLILFGAKGPEPSRGRGRVTAKVRGTRKAIPGAFIATMDSGRRGVWKRRSREQVPIYELHGPSIGRVLDLHKNGIMFRGTRVFLAEFDRLIVRILGTKKAA